jgi:hypothetical protein
MFVAVLTDQKIMIGNFDHLRIFIRFLLSVLWIRIGFMRIRIQGAKPMRIHVDPDPCQALKSQKVEFLHEKYTLIR